MMHSHKDKRSRVVLLGALVAGLSFTAGPAAAATYNIDAANGHLFATFGEAIYKDVQNDINGDNLTRVVFGHEIKLTTPNATGPEGSRTWVIHIPINSTNLIWSSTARGSNGSGTTGENGQRICSFTSSGLFSNCGAQVGANVTSSVLVPSGGTAFSQTTMTILCQLGLCHPAFRLTSIQAHN